MIEHFSRYYPQIGRLAGGYGLLVSLIVLVLTLTDGPEWLTVVLVIPCLFVSALFFFWGMKFHWRAEIATRLSEQYLREIVTGIPVILFVLDKQGRFTLIEGKGLSAFPGTASNILGKTAQQVFNNQADIMGAIKQAMNGENANFVAEFAGQTFESSYTPLWRGSHTPSGVIGVSVNISERQSAQTALAQARDEALEASRLKSEFLATISHEIRTPMNGIIGMTELLMTTNLDDEQHEFAQITYDEAFHLLRIINDILDYAKIEAQKIQLENTDFPLNLVLESVSEQIGSTIEEKRLKYEVVVAPDVPVNLHGDAQRLRQILFNLIENAVKFTPKGSIGVNVRVEQIHQRDDEVMLRFSVMDTGIGVPQHAFKYLFQPFSQVDGSNTRRYGGTGLGLAICKHLVKLMGGEIGLDTEEGKGSTFWFTAVFKSARKITVNMNDMMLIETGDEDIKEDIGAILLLESNPMSRNVVTRQITRLGYLVYVAATAEDGLCLLAELRENISLVLVDYHLPEADLAMFMKRVDEMGDIQVPIIAMTNKATLDSHEFILLPGMRDFIAKPLTISGLRSSLNIWLYDGTLPETTDVVVTDALT